MKHDNSKSDDFLVDPALEEYSQLHTSEEHDLLHDLDRQTHIKVLMPRMISGHLQGSFLAMLIKMAKPHRILELGTFTGYATLCMAMAMPDDCSITTLEKNPELACMAGEYFVKSGLGNRIHQVVGEAKEKIELLTELYDFVFIDADKKNNQFYFEAIMPKVKKGGFILVDNVLWDGKVISSDAPADRDTVAIRDFNDFVQADKRVKNILLPFRDGIMIMQKI